MAAPAGFAGQAGYKSESVWGTGVVVDTFVPILSEAIEADIDRLDSKGIRAGRRVTALWKPGAKKYSGPVKLELPTLSIAALWKHAFGTVVTTGTGPYTHTYTPGDLTTDSFTLQIGRPDIAGTVQPFTFAGTKIREWELECKAGEIAELTLDVSAATETTATALASASYPAGLSMFVFTEATLTIAGSAVNTVRSCNLKGANTLADDRHRLGSATVKEQLESGVREYTGEVSADFESLTAYNRFVNGTEAALVLAFTSGADTLTFTCNVRFDGKSPMIGGADELLEQPLPFKCVHATADASAITAVLVNGQTTAA
jgi:hypothetical protein